ncbi:MAG: Mor transcription activator family protein [Thermodesulfobacteriota bacterium]
MAEQTLNSLPDEALPRAEELPGDLALVAEIVGVRQTLALVEAFRGTYIYCRNLDHLERQCRNRAIRAEADRRLAAGELISKLVPELARRYKLSEKTIWNILGSGDPEVDERQMGLFGVAGK